MREQRGDRNSYKRTDTQKGRGRKLETRLGVRQRKRRHRRIRGKGQKPRKGGGRKAEQTRGYEHGNG